MGFLKWADICTLIKIWQRQNTVSISCIKKVLMWVTIRGIFLMWLPTKPQTVAVAAESAWDSQTRSNTCTFLCRNKQPCEVPLLSMLVNDDVIYRSACKGALQEAWCSLLWLSYSVCSHQTSSMVRSIPLLTGYHPHTNCNIYWVLLASFWWKFPKQMCLFTDHLSWWRNSRDLLWTLIWPVLLHTHMPFVC